MSQSSSHPFRQRDADTTRRYLLRMVQLDPLTQSQEMIQLRQRYCGLKRESVRRREPDSNESTNRRQAIERRIEQVRQDFWRLEVHQLLEILKVGDVSEFPDLNGNLNVLRDKIRHRQALLRLGQHRLVEPSLYQTLRRLQTLPAKEAGQVKEDFLHKYTLRPRRKKVTRMIRMMEKEFPELFQLESNWFRQIRSLGPRAKPVDNKLTLDLPSGAWWFIFIFVYIVIQMAALIG